MRLRRAWSATSLAAIGLVAMAGCVHPVDVPTTPKSRTGKVTLFERPDGLGQIALQVIDQRKGFGTQALSQADDWDEVRLRLSSSKLRAPRQASLVYGDASFTTLRQKTYQTDTLGLLPAASDYQLMVTLASHSIVLGQGASDSISVGPGSVATVSIYVNTVGDLTFVNSDYVTATGSLELASGSLGYPELVAGTAVVVQPNFPAVPPSVPASERFASLYTEVRSLDGTLLVPTSSVTVIEPASQNVALPLLPAGTNEAVQRVTVVGLNSANEVIATKTRHILTMRGAGLSLDLDPPLPTAYRVYRRTAGNPGRP